MKRNQASSCNYAANASRVGVPKNNAPRNRNVNDRLKRLEDLVSSFLDDGPTVQSREISLREGAVNENETPMSILGIPAGLPALSGEGTRSYETIEQQAADMETPRMLETPSGQIRYVNASHWLSILDDIKELREHLSPPGDSSDNTPILNDGPYRNTGGTPEHGVNILFGMSQDPSLQEILSTLPPQPACDRLVSHYFNTRYQVLGV